MLVVIFTATFSNPDEEYQQTASRLRELALSKYGCLEFRSACEDNTEIAISHWPDEDHIQRWKQDPEHLAAQKRGREKWYASWQIEIAEIVRRTQAT